MCKEGCYWLNIKRDDETGDDYYWCGLENKYAPVDEECISND